MGKKTFKIPPYNENSGKIGLDSKAIAIVSNNEYPIFCFRHLHRNYGIDNLIANTNKNFTKDFIKRLEHLSKLSWRAIQFSDRRKPGCSFSNNLICFSKCLSSTRSIIIERESLNSLTCLSVRLVSPKCFSAFYY